MPMRGSRFRAKLRRLADFALLAAFLTLTAVAYGVFLTGAGRMMLSPVPEFADSYQSGRNPWAAATAAPAPPSRLAAIPSSPALEHRR
jgi:hypothetical protein